MAPGQAPVTFADARQYLRDKWGAFVAFGPTVIDLQHRAAEAGFRAREAGDTERQELAKQIIRRLGDLNVAHGRALDTMAGVAEWVGLSGYPGLGAVPVAAVTAITGLALTVTWFFAAYNAEARALAAIEAGTLTAAEYASIKSGVSSMPGQVLGGVADLGRLALYGGALWLAYQVWIVYAPARPKRRARRNPPLVTLDTNPGRGSGTVGAETFGERVYAVLYRHADDGGEWVHEFGPGVEMHANDDGSVTLAHKRGRRIWEEF
jgi:hypothetical protein